MQSGLIGHHGALAQSHVVKQSECVSEYVEMAINWIEGAVVRETERK